MNKRHAHFAADDQTDDGFTWSDIGWSVVIGLLVVAAWVFDALHFIYRLIHACLDVVILGKFRDDEDAGIRRQFK